MPEHRLYIVTDDAAALQQAVRELNQQQLAELQSLAPEPGAPNWLAWVYADSVQGHANNALQLLGLHDSGLFNETERTDVRRAVRRRLLAIEALTNAAAQEMERDE